MATGAVTAQFTMSDNDLNKLKLNQNLGTNPANTFIEVLPGNMLYESGTTMELSAISGISAIAASTVSPDGVRPEVVNNGFIQFDLNSGQFTLSFTEPVNVATISLPDGLYFQHFSDVDQPSDVFNVMELDCPSATCFNGVNVTFLLTRSELNRIKLNPRVCSAAGNCWLTINETFIQDMGINFIKPVPDGFRSDIRYALDFIDDMSAPVLGSFNLNMTSQLLVLLFDEPVDTSKFNFSGITLQGASSVLPTQTEMYYTLTGGEIVSGAGTQVRIQLSTMDVNELQSRPLVATTPANTYLSLSSSLSLRDVTYLHNPVQAIPSTAARLVSNYQSDTAPPEIQSFILDLDSNTLRLTFSEAVLVNQLDLSKVRLTSSRVGAVVRQLTGGTALPTPLAAASVVVFNLSEEDLTFLEERSDIATSITNTYLAAYSSFATDTNIVSSLEIPISSAIQADEVISDTSSPNFVSFSLDMNRGELALMFDDVIDASTFAVNAIIFQNGVFRQPLQWHTLSSESTNSSLDNGFVVNVTLGLEDLNRVKQIRNLATSDLNTYLTMTASVADDVHGEDVIAVTDGKAIRASQFTPDTTAPVLIEWRFDIEHGQFILSFSETVDITTFQSSQVSLLSGPGGESLSLMTPAALIPSDAADVFAVQLTSADLNYIKFQTGLGTTKENSYLALTSTAIVDMSNNMVKSVPPATPIQAMEVISDTSRAVLTQFSLDMNTGLLSLTFDETVDASTVNISAFTLVNRPAGYTSSHTISAPSSSTVVDSHVINITLSQDDLNDIKSISDLATMISDTYITAVEDAVRDMSTNLLVPINDQSALQVTNYTADTTFPQLQSFSLNMSTGELVLTFSETVKGSSLDPTQLTIKNDPGNTGRAIPISGGVFSQVNQPTLTLTLTSDDLNQLKLNRDIATGTPDTFLSLTSTTVQDQAGNSVTAIPSNNARRVIGFTPDSISPELVSFDLNLETRKAILTFDEAIDSATFVITGITFQNRPSDATQSVSISALSSTTSTPGTVFTLDLHSDDFDNLAAAFPLATMEENTYISVIAGVVHDMNNNPSVAIPTNNALKIRNHTEDKTRPTLDSFSLDLDNGFLLLTFSETVNLTSFNPTQLTLQDTASAPTRSRTLSGGMSTRPENNVISLMLEPSDLNYIKADSMLASLASETYLSLTSSTVQDMNSNFIEPIPMNNGQWVAAGFTTDSTNPILDTFDVNFNTGVLSVSFDEPILVSTFQPTQITLSNSNGDSLMLSEGDILSSNRLTYVRMEFTMSDLNELKRIRVCTSSSQCFLSASSSAVSDVSNNMNAPANSVPVTGYTEDSTRPAVVKFTNFNLDAGTFTLEFSETVDSASAAANTVEFHDRYINATHTFSPSDTLNVSSDNTNITFYLEMTDLNLLKLDTELCTQPSNCWLRLPAAFISDVSRNEVLPILPGTMATYHYPANFTPDTTPPELISYDIDLDNGLMTFTFNEIVREAAFTPLNMTFHNTTTADVTQVLYDQGSHVRGDNGLTISWNMTTSDLNLLKSHVMFFTSVSNSFISYYHLIDDVSGVSTEPRDAIQPKAVLPDTTRPQLVSFLSFSFDNSSFTLLFDEAMNISSLNLQDLAIAENQTYSTSIYDKHYLDPRRSHIFRNGTVTNATHYYQPGRYMLYDCRSDLSFIFDNSTLSMMNVVMAANATETPTNSSVSGSGFGSASGSGSGSDDIINMTTVPPTIGVTTPLMPPVDPYPVWLLGCVIELIVPVREPWYHLTGGDAFYANERKTQIIVQLNRHDARILKLNRTLAVDDSNTFIAYNDTAISDLSGHEVVPISLFDATQLNSGAFIRDTTPPSLEAFDIDLNQGTLTLSFDDVVDLQSLVPTEIILLNSPGSNTTYQIQGRYYSLVPLGALDDYHIQFRLDEDDLNAIKIIRNLATSEKNTYICITQDVAVDIVGQRINELPHDKAFVVQNFTADTTRPRLLNFTLNIEDGILVLTFSEAIDPTTITFSSITIQNARTNSSASHSLTGGFLERNDTGTVILTIQLVKYDRSAYQSIANFTAFNTFLALRNDTIRDMNGNLVVPVEEGQLLQATNVVPQSSSPVLESFTLDLNNNFVILTFSKAVNASTLNTSAILVLNDATPDSLEKERLSTFSQVTATEMNAVLYVKLTEENEDNLKRFMRPIANSRNDSFLSIEFGAVYDFIGNPLNASVNDVFQAELYLEG